MNRIQCTVFVLLALLAGCENKEAQPRYKGETTFSSEKMLSGESYIVYGYSFDQARSIAYPVPGADHPDIILVNKTDNMNNITGAVLSSPDNMHGFHLDGAFGSPEDAATFFDDYALVTDSVFSELSEDVEPNQVWTFKGINGNFAKLLIREVTIKMDSKVEDYVEVKVEYQYQPDGSKTFDN